MKFQIEVTDTFGGEANYSWVNRRTVTCKGESDYAIVRAAKRAAGWNGIRCRVENWGDTIAVYPVGICQVMFIDFPESE